MLAPVCSLDAQLLYASAQLGNQMGQYSMSRHSLLGLSIVQFQGHAVMYLVVGAIIISAQFHIIDASSIQCNMILESSVPLLKNYAIS